MGNRVLIDEANGVYRVGKRYEAEDGVQVFPAEGRYYTSSVEDMARSASVSVSLMRKVLRKQAATEGRQYGENRVTKNTIPTKTYADLRKERDAWRDAYLQLESEYNTLKDEYDEIRGGPLDDN